jgi:hypothetical protein
MDARLQQILQQQQAAGFPGLAGTEVHATVRIADHLLNQVIAASLPASGALRRITVRSHERNWFEVKLTLAKLAAFPPITLELAIDRQPQLPADALLGLRVTGGAGGLMRLAAPILGKMIALVPGIRLEGERVVVDLRALLQQAGYESLLNYVQHLSVTCEEAGVALLVTARQSNTTVIMNAGT